MASDGSKRLRKAAKALALATVEERRATLAEAERLRQAAAPVGVAVDQERAARVARVGRALSDPIRVGLFDVIRAHGDEIGQRELQPLFPVGQPTLSHHLRKLVDAGLLSARRQGRSTSYLADPAGLELLRSWAG